MKPRTLLYVGCIGYDNAGDEACLEGARHTVGHRLKDGWHFEAVSAYDLEPAETPFDALVLGGGTLLSPHGHIGDDALREARERRVPYFIFCTGLESAEWEGPADEEARQAFVRLVEGASAIGVRGPRSRDYLAASGVARRRIRIVGDLAAGMELDTYGPEQRNHAPRRLAVNVGTSFGRVWGGDEDSMARELICALDRLDEDDWQILLFPVWPRDLELQSTVADALSHRPGLESLEEVRTPTAIIDLLRGVDVAIAMKLHAGIFAALAGTPYVPWSYRPKVEDFAAAIGMEDYVVRTDRPADDLLETLESLVRAERSVRRQMTRQVERMRERVNHFAAEIVGELG